MFISSTIYHTMKNNSIHKYVLRIIDHSMIYVAISGTYTPVLLHVVGGWIGWAVFTLLWGTTIWGILYKSIATRVNPKLLNRISCNGMVGVIFSSYHFNENIALVYFIYISRWSCVFYWRLVLCSKE